MSVTTDEKAVCKGRGLLHISTEEQIAAVQLKNPV